MIIRRANLKDYKELTRLRNLFFDWCLTNGFGLNPDYNRVGLSLEVSKRIRSKKFFYFVAEENKKLCGYILITEKNDKRFKERRWGFINQLFIEEQYRCDGLGKKILDEACTFLKNKGLNQVKLETLFSSHITRKFYYNNGFGDYYIALKKSL